MAIDGIFIHYLVKELNNELIGGRINKITQPSPLELIWHVRANHQNIQLLLSSELNFPCVYISTAKRVNPDTPYSFCMNMRKYLERGIIKRIWQVDNDRIVIIDIRAYNELGDETTYHLVFEIMGRNANIILITSDFIIIDSIRKLSPGLQELRTILPKAKYTFPPKQGLIHPFTSELTDQAMFEHLRNLEGISPLLRNAINYGGSVKQIINQNVHPVLIKADPKPAFYVFDLPHLEGERIYYSTISSLLETVKTSLFKESNPLASQLLRVVRRELSHQLNKLGNLKDDLNDAINKVDQKNAALLLQANLYRIRPGDEAITVDDYFNPGQEVTIKLDPTLSPSQNLQLYFTKIKKSESAVEHLHREIKKTTNEITYLESLIDQITKANDIDLVEIKAELLSENYLSGPKVKIKPPKSYLSYHVDGALIMVGKNNLQNNYLTHTVASKNDYWFHVQNAPSAHVILRTTSPTETQIRAAANLCALHSPFSKSSSVPVDYTLIKYIKKIPGQKGSFVTYSNQKTIYIDPDESKLKELTLL